MVSNNAIGIAMVAVLLGTTAVFPSLEDSLKISASGIKAQIYRQQIMAENIANIGTTKTQNGLPYRRKVPVLQPAEKGVRVAGVVQDPRPFVEVYDPSNPLADKNGFVKMPNVNVSTEITDMTYSSVLLEANTNAYNVSKTMYQAALELVK